MDGCVLPVQRLRLLLLRQSFVCDKEIKDGTLMSTPVFAESVRHGGWYALEGNLP